MKKINLYYPIIITIFILFTLITWMNDVGISLKDLENLVIYFDKFELWHFLTFNNNKILLLIFPLLLMYKVLKDLKENFKLKDIWLRNSFIIGIYIFIIFIITNLLTLNSRGLSVYLLGIGNVSQFVFMIFTILISILVSIFIINITLITNEYYNKFPFNLILSYVLLVFCQIIFAKFIGPLLAKLFPFYQIETSFNLFNMLSLSSNVIIIFIFGLILSVFSTFIYKDLIKDE